MLLDIWLLETKTEMLVSCTAGGNGKYRDVFRSKYLNILDFVFGNAGVTEGAICHRPSNFDMIARVNHRIKKSASSLGLVMNANSGTAPALTAITSSRSEGDFRNATAAATDSHDIANNIASSSRAVDHDVSYSAAATATRPADEALKAAGRGQPVASYENDSGHSLAGTGAGSSACRTSVPPVHLPLCEDYWCDDDAASPTASWLAAGCATIQHVSSEISFSSVCADVRKSREHSSCSLDSYGRQSFETAPASVHSDGRPPSDEPSVLSSLANEYQIDCHANAATLNSPSSAHINSSNSNGNVSRATRRSSKKSGRHRTSSCPAPLAPRNRSPVNKSSADSASAMTGSVSSSDFQLVDAAGPSDTNTGVEAILKRFPSAASLLELHPALAASASALQAAETNQAKPAAVS